MTSIQIPQISTQSQIIEFFERTAGEWKSQRRYYTLNQDVEPEEVISIIKIEFLHQGSAPLVKLAGLHQLEANALIGGTQVSWESNYIRSNRKALQGSTIFGVLENILYRDRGFATSKPVTAVCHLPNSSTLCLKTEYGGSSFEEEIKLIGQQYRTRQTIISRAGEELMIGQYLEQRM
ncbi:MAG: putative phycocyanobilin lyase CpcS 2 [Chroococcopsis gigantea SAG 12.99]|nr:putative phycocyanobilin lyase CpcS 2 [Chroococcopsis gigantea SAG 12.99]